MDDLTLRLVEAVERCARALEQSVVLAAEMGELARAAERDRKQMVERAEAQEEFLARALAGQTTLDS